MTSVLYRCWPVHADASSAGCFAVLCNLRSIRRSVLASVYQTLVTAPVLSRLEYGNATLIRIRLPCVVIFNLCSTPLLDLSLIFGAQTISLRRSPAFTSCARLSAYNSNWRCWSSNRCMDWLGSTWSTILAAYSWHAYQASAVISADTSTGGTGGAACNYRRPNIPCGLLQTLERPAQRCRRLPDCRSLGGWNISFFNVSFSWHSQCFCVQFIFLWTLIFFI